MKNSMLICQVNTLQQAQDCLLPMGITSENVAHRFGVTRQEQDQAAVSFEYIFSVFHFLWKITILIFMKSLFSLNLIGGQQQPSLLGSLKKR